MIKVEGLTELEELFGKLMAEFHGILLTSDELAKALGYRTGNAMRMANHKKQFPIVLMVLPHRRNKFGLGEEVAQWLLSQRQQNCGSPIDIDTRYMKTLSKEKKRSLGREYGFLLHTSDLIAILGLESSQDLESMIKSKSVPIPIFDIKQRRGHWFALLIEALPFLSDQGLI